MASAIRKSLKITRLINGRLSFSTSKLFNFNSGRIIKPYKHSRNDRVCYATAAQKQVTSDESMMQNDPLSTSNNQDLTPIDRALSRIDFLIRRSGRIQMKEISTAFSMITSKEITTSTHGLYLLRSCKYCYAEPPSKRIELINQIWNRYQELGIQFDARHYNALLDVHISNGLAFNPVEILDSMEDSKIEPNKTTYMLVMKKYCEDGDVNGASEILEHMKEKGLPANEDVFNNLIQGHVKNKDFGGAQDIIEVMRSSNLQPNADTYAILACGYAMSGNKDEMMACLKKINGESMVQNYLKVINTLASSGNHQDIDDVLSMIEYKDIYQHEFINSAVELIHKGFVDIAYKVMSSSFSPEYDQGAHIFLKQLIRTGKPISEIILYYNKLVEKGIPDMIFTAALRTAVEQGRFECIAPLFKELANKGQTIRSSNFWPLFTALKSKKSTDDVWIILKHMSEFGVPADINTYSDVICPLVEKCDPKHVLREVEKSGQAKTTAADALFCHYCNLGNIDYAYCLIEITYVGVSEKLKVQEFVNLYGHLNKSSVDKYLKILKYMFMNGNQTPEYKDIRGKLLAELISAKPNLLEMLMNRFNDLTFSQEVLNSCSEILLQKKPYKRGYQNALKTLQDMSQAREILNKKDLTVEEENMEINYLQTQQVSCWSFLLKRINHHINTKNLTRVSELLAVFDSMKLSYSPLLYSNLTAFYCMASDVEKAAEYYNKLKAEFPSFKLDLVKVLDYVTLLIKYHKLDESIEVMKNIIEPHNFKSRDNVVQRVRNLVLAVSNTNDAEFAKNMHNLLFPLSKEFKAKKVFLDSVLQLHLNRKDLNAAYEEYKKCINDYHTPAGLSILLKKCISLSEKDILQKVIDLTISCVSESYALLELSLAFLETRNFEKACAVIASLGQRADPKDVEDLCSRLLNQNKLHELEHFINITRPLNHDNRENLYYFLIKSYANKNDCNKVLELCDQLKREVGEFSQKIVDLIQNLFTKNNQPVPLSFMSKDSSESNPLTVETTKVFIEHLEAGNAELALKELSDMKKGYVRTLSLKTLTDLVDLCLQENYISDLAMIVNVMSYIIENARDVLKPVVEKYSSAGDVEKLIAIARFFPDFSLMTLGFNSYFCHAFIASGKQADLFTQLEQHVEKKNKLFSIAAFEELLKYPEYEDRVFDLAVKYYDSKFTFPMSVVWAIYFSKENYEKADKIFKNFSIVIDRTDNIILRAVRKNENAALGQKYVNAVKSLNLRNRVKERAYGAVVDVLVLKGMYDEAVALVVESEDLNLQLSKYYLSTLITLKNALEKENKPVPFHILSEASSGSSSDSE